MCVSVPVVGVGVVRWNRSGTYTRQWNGRGDTYEATTTTELGFGSNAIITRAATRRLQHFIRLSHLVANCNWNWQYAPRDGPEGTDRPTEGNTRNTGILIELYKCSVSAKWNYENKKIIIKSTPSTLYGVGKVRIRIRRGMAEWWSEIANPAVQPFCTWTTLLPKENRKLPLPWLIKSVW